MERIREEMLEAGLAGHYEALAPFARRAVYMELEEGDCDTGMSKMGGEPDLPAGMEWPRTEEGIPLSFIAQINFAEVYPHDMGTELPEKGMLWFFYDCSDEGMPWGFDPEDSDGWRVFFRENAELERIEAPDNLEVSFTEASIAFESRMDLPSYDSDILGDTELPEEEEDAYFDWMEDREGSCNKLLGHSDNIQDGMELECEYVANGIYCGDPSGYEKAIEMGLEKNAARWKLLMQVESNEELGMMWGDLGRLYLWITEEDLKAKQFEKTWLILQCG